MDNLAHTLLGAALSEAGLRKKTGLALPVLLIAANLPDVDAVTVLTGDSLYWRRGWTHGPIGLAVLPILLTLAALALDRLQARSGRRPESRSAVHPGWLLALAYIGAVSHPLLDFLNTYGIRCLMPFSERFFYGDALFIVDVWMWGLLGWGIWASRGRRRREAKGASRPAAVSIVAVTLYAGAMGLASLAAERLVARDLVAMGMPEPKRVLASPVPIDPFRRRIVFDTGSSYGFGDIRWTPAAQIRIEPGRIPTNMHDPAVKRARRESREVWSFLYWSRFPFAAIERETDTTRVIIGDARYNRRPADGRFSVSAILPDPARPAEPARDSSLSGKACCDTGNEFHRQGL